MSCAADLVLDEAQAIELDALGARVQQLYGMPMDVEWARCRGRVLDRAGPSDHRPERPEFEEWNDSLKGDYLWTAGNFGEAIPDVMTPITWSFVRLFIHEAMSGSAMPGFDMVGNIGGRFYMNLSPIYAITTALRVKSLRSGVEDVFGKVPPGLVVPKVNIFRLEILKQVFPTAIRVRLRARANGKGLSAFLNSSPQRCEDLRARVVATGSGPALAQLVRAGDPGRTWSPRAACWKPQAARADPACSSPAPPCAR